MIWNFSDIYKKIEVIVRKQKAGEISAGAMLEQSGQQSGWQRYNFTFYLAFARRR